MTLLQAIDLIRPAMNRDAMVWSDIGAGTGMFTQALMSALSEASADEEGSRGRLEFGQPLPESRVYAVDKSPHALWALKSTPEVEVIVVEADFNNPLDLPLLDGIVMANALHYAKDHVAVLKNVLQTLKSGGTFILVEYDTDTANPPWVPYPVSFKKFENLCALAGLSAPVPIGKMESEYGGARIYSAFATKQR